MKRKSVISLIILGLGCLLSFLVLTKPQASPSALATDPGIESKTIAVKVISPHQAGKQTIPLLPQNGW